jgi:uncharacterized surface protein with fasciclin (FAS1) repeats
MKKNRFGGRWATFFLAAALFSTVTFSCKEDEADKVKPKAMTDVILENPEFSMLKDIMIHAGMSDAFRTQNYTLFAPSNDAFKKANIFSSSVITSMSDTLVKSFLNSHILLGSSKYDELKAGSYTAVEKKQKLTIEKKDSVVTINGSKIAKADVFAANGYIQVIDSVYVKVIK